MRFCCPLRARSSIALFNIHKSGRLPREKSAGLGDERLQTFHRLKEHQCTTTVSPIFQYYLAFQNTAAPLRTDS